MLEEVLWKRVVSAGYNGGEENMGVLTKSRRRTEDSGVRTALLTYVSRR